MYNVSDPFDPIFTQYVNTTPDDISREGLLFVKEKDGSEGKPLLIASHEINSATAIIEIIKGSASLFVATSKLDATRQRKIDIR